MNISSAFDVSDMTSYYLLCSCSMKTTLPILAYVQILSNIAVGNLAGKYNH